MLISFWVHLEDWIQIKILNLDNVTGIAVISGVIVDVHAFDFCVYLLLVLKVC